MFIGSSSVPEGALFLISYRGHLHRDEKGSQDLDEDTADTSEANALDLLFAETTIPVPRVRRVVKCQWDFWIVMDYIPGPTLAHIWPALSMRRKNCVAFTLCRYVRQLRRLKVSATTPPGPLSTQGARISTQSGLTNNLSSVTARHNVRDKRIVSGKDSRNHVHIRAEDLFPSLRARCKPPHVSVASYTSILCIPCLSRTPLFPEKVAQ
jgi:hypothetical protein